MRTRAHHPAQLSSLRTMVVAPLILIALSGPASADFGAPTGYGTGDAPQNAAAADLNADGRPDVVAVNYGSASVSVLLGNGDGTLGTKTDFTVASYPLSSAIGDLNGDGRPDLAVAGGISNVVSVLLGTGDGTFGAKTDFVTGNYPGAVAIGDLNGDSRQDLVVANNNGGSISVLLGLGDGTFEPKTDLATGNLPFDVAIADLNADTKQDLVVSNYGETTISILLGNGNGTFAPKTDLDADERPAGIRLADLNADGHLDLVVAIYNNLFADHRGSAIAVRLGNGDGTFGASANLFVIPADDSPVLGGPKSVAVADLDADGHLDVAAAIHDASPGTPPPGAVAVLLGNGDGTFGARTNYAPGINARSIAIADFNADGRPDLLAANPEANTVSILLNEDQPPPAGSMAFDLTPGTLSPSSRGRWVTGFLEPAPPLAPGDIDIASILVNGSVPVDPEAPTAVGDHDADGVPDLLVKFDRGAVVSTLTAGDNVPVEVTGTVDGQSFSGTDYIRVLRGGKPAPGAGRHVTAGRAAQVAGSSPNGAPNDEMDTAAGGGVGIELALSARGPDRGMAGDGHVRVEFALRDGTPARLELADVAGRVLASRQVGTLGPGSHALDLSPGGGLRSGIYFLRLTQGGDEVRTRAAVLR